jgi:preprotein translocase subunit YajC
MEGTISSILMIVVMIVIFYFMLIRPENKRKKEANEMRESLAVGDQITTIGGIVGTVCAVKENSVVIETGADRVRLEMMKWAISSKGVQVSEDGQGSDKK